MRCGLSLCRASALKNGVAPLCHSNRKGIDMSMENIQQFYAKAFKNPHLVDGLKKLSDPDAYAKKAVELGAANGCTFTPQEVGEWIKAKGAAMTNGELDDQELEAVAGGKGNPAQILGGIGEIVGGSLISWYTTSGGSLGGSGGAAIVVDGAHRISDNSK